MNPLKYFSNLFYLERLDTETAKKFIEQLGDREDFSIKELLNFINREKDKLIKKNYLLDNFNEIINEQWKNDKKKMRRRDFLNNYFVTPPESEDTLTKWRKNEPKREADKLNLLADLEKMPIAKQMFNSYYFEMRKKELERKNPLQAYEQLESLELGMLAIEYSLTHLLLSAIRRLALDIKGDVRKELDKKHQKFVQNIYDFNNKKALNKLDIERISDQINSSDRFKDKKVSYIFPSEIEIYNKLIRYLEDEISMLEYYQEIESYIDEEYYKEWDFYRQKSKGMKNHRLSTKKIATQKRYIKTEISFSNIHLWQTAKVSNFALSKKKSISPIKLKRLKIEDWYHTNHKICLQLIYIGDGNFSFSIQKYPFIKNRIYKKSIPKMKNKKLIQRNTSELYHRAIRYYFVMNVILKKISLKVNKKYKPTIWQRGYNHFVISKSLNRRQSKTPDILTKLQNKDYFTNIDISEYTPK